MTAAPGTLWFESALLPGGWADGVAVTVGAAGDIDGVATGAPAGTGRGAGGCVVPGVTNLHSHAHQRAMAGLAERSGDGGDSFWTWREAMYRAVDRIRPEHLEAVAAQVYAEMLAAGYTGVAEFHYLHHDLDGRPYADVAEMSRRVLAAARAAGIGITCLPVLYANGGFGGRPPEPAQRRFVNRADRFLDIVGALRDDCRGDPGCAVGVAPHSLRAVTRDLLDEVLPAARERGAGPVHVHVAEQVREVAECVA